MIIGSEIMYHIYDGGSGSSDRRVTIGYCKENPEEVLLQLIRTHCIHSYKSLCWRPIEEYPSNCEGLVIYPVESEDMKGISITGKLSDLMTDKFIKRAEWNKFSPEKFQTTIDKKHEYAEHFDGNNKRKNVYMNIVNDWNDILSKIKC